jgi:hypothetical protein
LPKIADLETLGSSTEQRGHNFPKFLKSIHHHAITNFKNSKDISKAILEFTDPYTELNTSKLSLIQIRRKGNLDLVPPAAEEDAEATFVREADNTDRKEEAKLSYGIHVNSMFEREKDLTQNLTILWATIMGQCTRTPRGSTW